MDELCWLTGYLPKIISPRANVINKFRSIAAETMHSGCLKLVTRLLVVAANRNVIFQPWDLEQPIRVLFSE